MLFYQSLIIITRLQPSQIRNQLNLLIDHQDCQSKQIQEEFVKNKEKVVMSSSQQNDPSKNLNQFNRFLENNVDFLKQKFSQHFVQAFPMNQLQTKAKIQGGIKFIYDVFSFQKYQKDQKMNATLKKSLRDNILCFLKEQSQKQGKKFDAQQGIKLLKFCIENNQMFAVHYDKKQKKREEPKQKQTLEYKQQQKPAENDQSPKQQQQQEDQSENKLVQNGVNVQNNQFYPTHKSKHKINIDENVIQINKNVEFSIASKIQEQKANDQLLKQQAKIVFHFYCRQQLNSGGPNATFDKILHQSSTMTLGKFIAFSKTTGILYTAKFQVNRPRDQKVLDKKTINQLFRKIGKAQKQIDFDQFFQLIKKLYQIDGSVYDKLNMNKEENKNKILRKLKYLNAPFNMKGQFQNQILANIDQQPYVHNITAHSGKFQSSLNEQVEQRRQKLRLLPHKPYPNANFMRAPAYVNEKAGIQNQYCLKQSKLLQQQLFQSKERGNNQFITQGKPVSKTTMNQKKDSSKIRLQNSKVSFDNGHRLFDDNQLGILQDLIVDDQQNDDEFLKDYKIPKFSSNAGLRKKPNNPSLLHRNSQQTQEYEHRFGLIRGQRKNVVDLLKQRIKQVQKTQRKQLTSLQNKRKSISNYNNKHRY